MLLICSKGCVYLIDRKFEISKLIGVFFCVKNYESQLLTDTLLDGELIENINNENNNHSNKYMIFDAVAFNGNFIGNLDLNKRLTCVQNYVLNYFRSDNANFFIELKTFYKLKHLKYLFDVIIPSLKHKSDGIVFTPVDEAYKPGTWTTCLKWKAPKHNTVDFALDYETLYSDEQQKYIKLFTIHLFQTGTKLPQKHAYLNLSENEYDEFCKNTQNLVNTIIECIYDSDASVYVPTSNKYDGGFTQKPSWKFKNFRKDKNSANDVNSYNRICRSIYDNIQQEDLLKNLQL